MTNRIDSINTIVLKQCREQLGLTISEVEKKIKKIYQIENGEVNPTFKQIDILSALYNVPRWVFISDSLPKEYQFDEAIPAFRQFSQIHSDLFDDAKVRRLIAKVEQLRDLMIDLVEDMPDTAIDRFTPPAIEQQVTPEAAAIRIKKWLGIDDEAMPFDSWKQTVEKKNIFVFMTSKYAGWSNIGKTTFRGLSVFHDTLPVIIINDSDAKKAQSFTLLHELGHLIKKENAIDNWENHSKAEENWCDEFAGNLLMPKSTVVKMTSGKAVDFNLVKKISKDMNVSSYAFLVRLRQLALVEYSIYQKIETEIHREYIEIQTRLKERSGGPARNRPKEVFNQYGRVFSNVVFQAYNDHEIGLHKLSSLFGLKKAAQVFEVQALL